MLRLGLVGFGGRVMSLKVEDVMVKDIVIIGYRG